MTDGPNLHQLGLVGCGSFGTFVDRAIGDVPGARLVAVVDANLQLASRRPAWRSGHVAADGRSFWELDLIEHLTRGGLVVPVPLPH